MKSRVKRRKKIIYPTHPVISYLGDAAEMVLRKQEITFVNAYYHFSDPTKFCQAFPHREIFLYKRLIKAFRKIVYLYGIPSIPRFIKGKLTRKQFLDAPIELHSFSTRLYHPLRNADLFSLQEIIDLGIDGVKQHRLIGDKGVLEIKKILKKKRCDHLFV